MAKNYKINIEFNLNELQFAELTNRARFKCAEANNLEMGMKDSEIVEQYLTSLVNWYKGECE